MINSRNIDNVSEATPIKKSTEPRVDMNSNMDGSRSLS
jgi:hypothetical protein